MLLPIEIRDNIYLYLIKWGKRHLNHTCLYSTSINCHIPAGLLLISKTFSSEILYTLSFWLKVSMTLSSVFFHMPLLFESLTVVFRTTTRELFVHIKRTTSAECMRHRPYRCASFPESHVSKQLIFLSEDLDFPILTKLQVRIDISRDYITKNVLSNISSIWSVEDIDMDVKHDKWNNMPYQKLDKRLQRGGRTICITAMLCYL